MLVEASPKAYHILFQQNPHPYLSQSFIKLNEIKADRIVWLIEAETKSSMGLIAGIKNDTLLSPFSAPFGGFHFRKDNQYVGEIETFIKKLLNYIDYNNIKQIEITLPPDIYHQSFNSKVINIMLRLGFEINIPDITNYINLIKFSGTFSNRGARKYYKQGIRNDLKFTVLQNEQEQKKGFEIIQQNREKFSRPMYMNFNDMVAISKLWPVDFFGVYDKLNNLISSGIFYRGHERIIQGIFWGDCDSGRPLRAIDFMSLNIWNFYKNLNYEAIDLGISTENGIPNEGLLRFKESHDCSSSLRYSLSWNREIMQPTE